MAATVVQQPQRITINYPTRSGASWPLFIAKEGGYYQKYGLDANLVFANHPAGVAMVIAGEAQMTAKLQIVRIEMICFFIFAPVLLFLVSS